MGGFFGNGLPAASFLPALARIHQALEQTQGVLHLRVSKLDGDAMLRRDLRDHPLPLHAAVTRDAQSVFLYGHLQSEENGGFILVENGDDASAVNDGNLPVQRVRNIAGLAVNCPDACRGDLVSKRLLLLLACKPLLCKVGPICAAVRIGRRTNVQRI